MKRWTAFNTLVGAVPGAIPPPDRFLSRSRPDRNGRLGPFSILFLWQIPHFMAIAWRYREDYRRAGFRMLPCRDEEGRVTGLVSVLYCCALLPASLWPVTLESAGWLYGAGAVLLGLGYAYCAVNFAWKPSASSARNLFLGSILYLPILLILLVSDSR